MVAVTRCQRIYIGPLCNPPNGTHPIDVRLPSTFALAGDEALQAAEGIYQVIQEVYGWWRYCG